MEASFDALVPAATASFPADRFLRACCCLLHCALYDKKTRAHRFLSAQAAARLAKKNKKKAVSGGAAGNVALKRRKQQLVGALEAEAREFDEEDVARELALAREAAASKGRTSVDGLPLVSKASLPVGFEACVAHGGLAARDTLLQYEQQLEAHYGQHEDPVDAVLHFEHWTQRQRSDARDTALTHALSLVRDGGEVVGVIAGVQRRDRFSITIVHVMCAWRRQQLAEVLWRQLHASVGGGRATVECACCQAGAAARLLEVGTGL